LLEGKEMPDDPEFLPKLHEIRMNLTDPSLRCAVCQVLRALALQSEAQGVELEGSAGRSVSDEAFETLVAFFKGSLDACDAQNDVWCGRDLMVLAQLFRMEGAEGKPVTLLSRIYTHPLWNKVTFWEEVLVIAVCEAHAAEAVWRRNLAPGSQFTTPSMTAFLQRFVGYMMAFGISFEQSKISVLGTLRKSVTLLGPECVTAYGNMLLARYEVGGAQPEPAPMARTVPNFTEVTQASAPSAPTKPPVEDDFEAIALGFPAGDGMDPAETTPSCVGTEEAPSVQESNDDPDRSEEEKEVTSAESLALKELADAQPKLDDVFT